MRSCGVWPAGDIVKRRSDLGWQLLIFDSKGRNQLSSGTRAEQGSGNPRSDAHPKQSHLEWYEIEPLRCSDHCLYHATAARFEIRLDEPCEVISRRPRSTWRAVPILPGQYASPKWCPGEETHAKA